MRALFHAPAALRCLCSINDVDTLGCVDIHAVKSK